jgi:hypothetical protein
MEQSAGTFSQFINLYIPIHASPSDIPAMPAFRLAMPNMDLLERILARCELRRAIPVK